MTIDPSRLLLAAEAIAEDRGYEKAIEELQGKLEATNYTAKQERNVILWTISTLRRRHAEHGFYQHKARQEAAKA